MSYTKAEIDFKEYQMLRIIDELDVTAVEAISIVYQRRRWLPEHKVLILGGEFRRVATIARNWNLPLSKWRSIQPANLHYIRGLNRPIVLTGPGWLELFDTQERLSELGQTINYLQSVGAKNMWVSDRPGELFERNTGYDANQKLPR